MPTSISPPWRRVVDGLVLPSPWGGHPALDFCNTLAGWGGVVQHDYLHDYGHLLTFARDASLLDAETVSAVPSEGSSAELLRARRLRAAAYSVLHGEGHPDSWAMVSNAVEEAACSLQFVPSAHGARWTLPIALGVRLPVLALARSLGDLLVSEDAAYVSRCPGDGCGWLFLDRSGRRRWCSMAVCGNRAKARRHAGRAASRSGAAASRSGKATSRSGEA